MSGVTANRHSDSSARKFAPLGARRHYAELTLTCRNGLGCAPSCNAIALQPTGLEWTFMQVNEGALNQAIVLGLSSQRAALLCLVRGSAAS